MGVLPGRVLLGSWRLSTHMKLLHELGDHHLSTAGDNEAAFLHVFSLQSQMSIIK